jgi:23S rRNA pseudouridine2605 synthase
VGFPVSRLVRVEFGPFKLGDLKPGQYRPLKEQEIERLLLEAREEREKRGPSRRPRANRKKIGKRPNHSEE